MAYSSDEGTVGNPYRMVGLVCLGIVADRDMDRVVAAADVDRGMGLVVAAVGVDRDMSPVVVGVGIAIAAAVVGLMNRYPSCC